MPNSVIIENIIPREYQQNIVDNVIKSGSSLIVLPTGLGKTLIAIMLFDNLLKNKKSAKLLFLAPTKPLVEQHKDSITKMMINIPVEQLNGLIKPNKRIKLIEDNQIIVATPQTIENDLVAIKKSEFDLIIFDEAHRATGEYAYVKIAKHFDTCFKIGLTASPGTTKTEIKEVMQNLGLNNLEIKTEEDSDVLPYVNNVNVNWVTVSLPLPLLEINKLLREFVNEHAINVRKMGYPLRQDFTQRDLLINQKRIFEDLKEKRPYAFQAVSTIAAMMKIEHAITLLETQGMNSLKEYLERLETEFKDKESKAAKKIWTDERILKAKYIVEGLNLADIEHPKIKKLEELILTELNNNPEQKIIVFNHYRDSVSNLENILNKNPLITAKRFVGQASKGEDKGHSQKEQKEIIEDFKNGKYNVLLATSVAEEGLDIPSVDTIIFYEPVPSDIRSIQRRGRTGRFKDGQVYVLITQGTRDEAFFWASKSKEKSMMNAVKSLARKETIFDKLKKAESINKPKIEEKKEKPIVIKNNI
jgi:Fanconi anemia group M protein